MMKLTFDQIQAVTHGASRIWEQEGRICFSRLTEEQEEFFHTLSPDFFWIRARASAGVYLELETDSPTLSLTVETAPGSACTAVWLDVTVNGRLIGSLGSNETAVGVFSDTFSLGEGTKTLRITLPWGTQTELRELSLAEGSSLTPTHKKKRMLIFGDSITQGAFATHPSATYASRLTDFLEADAINKAIAGDTFHGELAELCEVGDFDYITVACGTNDWKKTTRQVFEQNCSAFYRTLSRKYPTARIFAITPIWRADPDRLTDVGTLRSVRDFIFELAEELPNVTPIDGYDFVPHDPAYFGDRRGHPTDEGFAHYAENLIRALRAHL